MTSRETLECRIYMTEDAMYQEGSKLDRHLHDLESGLVELNTLVHRLVCESGRMALDVKTGQIVRAVEAFEASIDLGEIKALADRITSLKGLVAGYEQEIEDLARPAGPEEFDPTAERVLAVTFS
jgi:hypothetical protein